MKTKMTNKMETKTKIHVYFHFCFHFCICFHFRFCFCFSFLFLLLFPFSFFFLFSFSFSFLFFFQSCFSFIFLVFIFKFSYGTSRPPYSWCYLELIIHCNLLLWHLEKKSSRGTLGQLPSWKTAHLLLACFVKRVRGNFDQLMNLEGL